MNEEIKEYKFTYLHVNHSLFTGTIKALSEKNRDGQMLSLLYNRYKRHLSLDGVVFELIKE